MSAKSQFHARQKDFKEKSKKIKEVQRNSKEFKGIVRLKAEQEEASRRYLSLFCFDCQRRNRAETGRGWRVKKDMKRVFPRALKGFKGTLKGFKGRSEMLSGKEARGGASRASAGLSSLVRLSAARNCERNVRPSEPFQTRR